MTIQHQPSCSYRYHEMASIILRGIVRSAFIASRYTAEPAELTDSYHNRMRLTLVHIHNKYANKIADAIEKMVVAPESDVDDWPCASYETAYTALNELSNSIAKEVAVPAYELNIDEIEGYFTNEN